MESKANIRTHEEIMAAFRVKEEKTMAAFRIKEEKTMAAFLVKNAKAKEIWDRMNQNRAAVTIAEYNSVVKEAIAEYNSVLKEAIAEYLSVVKEATAEYKLARSSDGQEDKAVSKNDSVAITTKPTKNTEKDFVQISAASSGKDEYMNTDSPDKDVLDAINILHQEQKQFLFSGTIKDPQDALDAAFQKINEQEKESFLEFQKKNDPRVLPASLREIDEALQLEIQKIDAEVDDAGVDKYKEYLKMNEIYVDWNKEHLFDEQSMKRLYIAKEKVLKESQDLKQKAREKAALKKELVNKKANANKMKIQENYEGKTSSGYEKLKAEKEVLYKRSQEARNKAYQIIRNEAYQIIMSELSLHNAVFDEYYAKSTKAPTEVFCFFEKQPQVRKQFDKKIERSIRSMARGLNSEYKCILTIEKSEFLLSKCDIINPKLKGRLKKRWAVGHFLLLRTQKDNLDYDVKVLKITDDILRSIDTQDASDMLTYLSNRLVLQQSLAFSVRQKIRQTQQMKASTQQTIRFVSPVLQVVQNNPELQFHGLEFLTTPLTSRTVLGFLKIAAEKKCSLFPSEMTSEMQQDQLTIFHQNFWAQPQEVRTRLIGQLVFSANSQESFETSKTVALLKEKLIPLNNEKGQPIPYTSEGRLILDRYLMHCPDDRTRQGFFASIIASNSAQGQDFNMGKTLTDILSRMGPAGGKTLQAIDSFDKTPADIKAATKTSKSDFSRPNIWDVWDRFLEVTPERMHDGQIKSILGCGSYGYTVAFETPNGQESAITLARPNVKEDALLQFDRFVKVAEDMEKIDKNKYGDFVDIIQTAQRLSYIETNFQIAGEQTKRAGELYYTGQEYSIDGYDFTVRAGKLYDFGDAYKQVELAHGVVLKDMPPKESFTKAAAKAVFISEMEQILSGKALDNDRHGGQMCVDKEGTIIMFDHGALDIDLNTRQLKQPTEEERYALGQALQSACLDLFKGRDLNEAVLDALSVSAQKNPETKTYLNSVKRAFLALGDILDLMGETASERKSAMNQCGFIFAKRAVFHEVLGQKDRVDPLIRSGVLALTPELGGYLLSPVKGVLNFFGKEKPAPEVQKKNEQQTVSDDKNEQRTVSDDKNEQQTVSDDKNEQQTVSDDKNEQRTGSDDKNEQRTGSDDKNEQGNSTGPSCVPNWVFVDSKEEGNPDKKSSQPNKKTISGADVCKILLDTLNRFDH